MPKIQHDVELRLLLLVLQKHNEHPNRSFHNAKYLEWKAKTLRLALQPLYHLSFLFLAAFPCEFRVLSVWRNPLDASLDLVLYSNTDSKYLECQIVCLFQLLVLRAPNFRLSVGLALLALAECRHLVQHSFGLHRDALDPQGRT